MNTYRFYIYRKSIYFVNKDFTDDMIRFSGKPRYNKYGYYGKLIFRKIHRVCGPNKDAVINYINKKWRLK